MIIGLTGQIGAGKTAAAGILKRLGAQVIDADQIGREVVEKSVTLRRKLARAFGSEILDRHNRLRRQKLAALAFSSEQGKRKLNALVHPYLLKELRRRVKRANNSKQVIVIDAALLLYWDMDQEVDFVIVIHASRAARLERLKRRGISRGDAMARENAQLPFAEFQRRADRVILNNGTAEDLRRKITKLTKPLFTRTS